jgi:hypothetical protein
MIRNMARRFKRERRPVSPRTITALRPPFRYSYSRDAYVLRGVGQRVGPVLKPQHGGRFERS